ncbi:hypothetical protein KVT40_000541 [Elsinoe batatas]|uniref:Uncharacterized protein n=1 Tax=Elsinoe batatas TaxID=2601811 RepID=A0A8K0LBI7_9PEZI|nr:hypothetical protein KVT40_000541 [Elsinoe batatas]
MLQDKAESPFAICRTARGMMYVVGDISELPRIYLEALYRLPDKIIQLPNDRTGDMAQSPNSSLHHCHSCVPYRYSARPMLYVPLRSYLRDVPMVARCGQSAHSFRGE